MGKKPDCVFFYTFPVGFNKSNQKHRNKAFFGQRDYFQQRINSHLEINRAISVNGIESNVGVDGN